MSRSKRTTPYWPIELYTLASPAEVSVFLEMYYKRLGQGRSNRSARRAGMWAVRHMKP